MAHKIIDGWTVEVRHADTRKIEYIGHFRCSADAEAEAQYWVDCQWAVRLYCNGCFQGTEEI